MTPILAAALILCADPYVRDGDTFRCDGNIKIRLWGIDAAELNTDAGPASRKALANITSGQTLVCRKRGKSFDRIVAQCFIEGRDIASEMVRAGHARDWPKFSHGWYSKDAPK